MADLSGYKIYDGSTTYIDQLQDMVDAIENLFNTLPVIQTSETVLALDTSAPATVDIDTSLGTYFYTDTALSDSAWTFTFSNPVDSGRLTTFKLELENAGVPVAGTGSLTWPTTTEFPGGKAAFEATLTSSGTDIITFATRDGGTTWSVIAAELDVKA